MQSNIRNVFPFAVARIGSDLLDDVTSDDVILYDGTLDDNMLDGNTPRNNCDLFAI